MSKNIKIRKGLNIRLKGTAQKITTVHNVEKFAIKPTDFIGVFPKLKVKEGDNIKTGEILFYNKYNEKIKFTSPVCGTISEIKRGNKRVLQEIKIETNGKDDSVDFGSADPNELSKEKIIEKLLLSGLWANIRQRPYSVIAKPDDDPKSIVISTFDTSPLAPDYDFIVHGKGEEFQTGLDALAKLSGGVIHLNIKSDDSHSKVFKNSKKVQINSFSGPHPAGNIGVQIHHLDPINKGDIVWFVNSQSVLMIGRLFLSGKYEAEKIIALCGSEVLKPKYYLTKVGACIEGLLKNNVKEGDKRYISGNVLTGKKIEKDGYIGFYDNQLTIIPEGKHFELLGWALPGLKKFSVSRTFFSWLSPKKEYSLNTNINGGKRAFVMSGEYEKVFPMNILPVHLLKAILTEDIDQMENLGIYEVDEEDFALCEVICTSKIEVQKIVRKGLDFMRKEME